MKTKFIFIFFLFSLNCFSQEIGTIRVGRFYNEKTQTLEGENYWFNSTISDVVCMLFETYSQSFNRLTMVFRVIKINNEMETIYKTENYDVDPSWNMTWDYIKFPNGEYKFKFFDTNGSLLGESHAFIIY